MIGLSFRLTAASILVAGVSCTALAAGPGFPRTEKSFNQFDADKDGKLSVVEVEPRSEKYLFRLDQNADGSLRSAKPRASGSNSAMMSMSLE